MAMKRAAGIVRYLQHVLHCQTKTINGLVILFCAGNERHLWRRCSRYIIVYNNLCTVLLIDKREIIHYTEKDKK